MKPGAAANAPIPEAAQHRVAPRHELEVAVDFESDSNFYTGLTQNISNGGVFIATHQLKRVGDHVRLKFTLPGANRQIACDTEVRWIRENSSLHRTDGATGMGVRFISLSDEDATAIDHFIKNRDSLFYDED